MVKTTSFLSASVKADNGFVNPASVIQSSTVSSIKISLSASSELAELTWAELSGLVEYNLLHKIYLSDNLLYVLVWDTFRSYWKWRPHTCTYVDEEMESQVLPEWLTLLHTFQESCNHQSTYISQYKTVHSTWNAEVLQEKKLPVPLVACTKNLEFLHASANKRKNSLRGPPVSTAPSPTNETYNLMNVLCVIVSPW